MKYYLVVAKENTFSLFRDTFIRKGDVFFTSEVSSNRFMGNISCGDIVLSCGENIEEYISTSVRIGIIGMVNPHSKLFLLVMPTRLSG